MSEEKRFRPYAAAYLVLKKDKKVLLLRRANTGYQDGNYSLIAGHLNGGETTEECIIREAKEEAGIDIKLDDLKVAYVMHRYRADREYFDIYLQTKRWSGNISNKEPDKCDGLEWFELNNLPDNVIPEVQLALENIEKEVCYGEIGWENR